MLVNKFKDEIVATNLICLMIIKMFASSTHLISLFVDILQDSITNVKERGFRSLF